MTTVFTAQDSTRVGYAKSILEAAGIVCFIQNEHTQTLGVSLLGYSHTPILDPALCVVDENRVEEAKALLQEHFGAAVGNDEWLCPACKESNPASFDLCWNCQTAKPLCPQS